jgi:ribosome biogenesis GTPase
LPEGLIVKALSGYYYVLPAGETAGTTIQCRARGIFKKKGITPLVGDKVLVELTANGEGTVHEIFPRRTELIRPPIANAELAVLVFAVTEPALNLQLLDKFLVHTEKAGMDSLICLTKADLLEKIGSGPHPDDVKRLYEQIGYDVVVTSAASGLGIETVRQKLSGKISVFAGQSGAGKSSLLNELVPGLKLETGEISAKLGRGKHTTRHVELIALPHGGFVADTPGFSQLDFAGMEANDLTACFREIAVLAGQCRFRGCTHRNEPDCSVIEARHSGRLAESRYMNYLQFYSELNDKKRRY